jgi:predicted restriction endonuclease
MASRNDWTRKQLLVAFALYCQMPFGKLDSRNKEIIRYAKLVGRTSGALAMKLNNIASLDPVITGSGRKGLPGASAADRAMWDEMQSDWQRFAVESQAALDALDKSKHSDLINEPSQEEVEYQGKNKQALVAIRVGQRFFRKSVLSAYKSCCCISEVSIPELLIASHIIPWRDDSKNRLNPRNGLCLSVLHDKAFDLGLITISKSLTVQVSNKLSKSKNQFLKSSMLDYAGARIKLPNKFQPDEIFLSYHREHVFKK